MKSYVLYIMGPEIKMSEMNNFFFNIVCISLEIIM